MMRTVTFDETCDLTFLVAPGTRDADVRATLTIEQAVKYAVSRVPTELRPSCTIYPHKGCASMPWPQIEARWHELQLA
jgi:hypothetical protein